MGQGAIPSSDVAKVIGMMLQIGMEQLDQLVTVPGVVEVSLGDQDGEGVVVVLVLVLVLIKDHFIIKRMLATWHPYTRASFLCQ